MGRPVLRRRPGPRCPLSGATIKHQNRCTRTDCDSIEARLWTHDGLQSPETTDDVLVPGKTTLPPQDGNRRRQAVGREPFHDRLEEKGINMYDIVTEFTHVHMVV